MHPRLVVLLSLLGFSVLISGVSFWYIEKWQATPVPHPAMAPVKTAPLPAGGLVELPQEVPAVVPIPGAKIDINAVCEQAPTYMTFTDWEYEKVFVDDCKAGKHPEVIEQYKANINLGDGAAI